MIWLGEFTAGETVPVRAQFHDDTGAAADPTGPFARMETGSGTFADLDTPTKRDSKTGYFGVDVDTSGYSAGIRTVRIGGTVATGKAVAAVYGFRVVAHRAESISQSSGKVTVGTCDDKTGYALTSAYDKAMDDVLAPLAVVDDLVDTLIARLTAARAGYLDKLNVSGTLAHSDAAATYKADVSALATVAKQDAAKTVIDTIAADYAKTGEAASAAATLGSPLQTDDERIDALALEASVQEVKAAVGSPAGAIAWTYELGEDRDGDGIPDRLEDGSLAWPIAGVRVYATAVDNSRAAVLDSGRTNAAGAVQLLLDPDTLPSDEGGDYVYVWRVPGGRWAFENPDKEYV